MLYIHIYLVYTDSLILLCLTRNPTDSVKHDVVCISFASKLNKTVKVILRTQFKMVIHVEKENV